MHTATLSSRFTAAVCAFALSVLTIGATVTVPAPAAAQFAGISSGALA